jgi:hypothetical protein
MGKRVILIVLGVIVLLIGAAAIAGGAGLMIVFGPDGRASSGTHHVTSNRVALVAPLNDIKGTNGFARVVGRVRVQFHVNSSRDAFVGIGPAASVERYLAGAPIDRVTDLEVDPFSLDTRPRAGNIEPAPPSQQTFWAVSDSGTNATVSWAIKDGSYRLVVMNADGSPQVAVNARASLTVPHLFAIGLGTLIVGIVIALLGLFMIVWGARQPQRASWPSAPPQSVGM